MDQWVDEHDEATGVELSPDATQAIARRMHPQDGNVSDALIAFLVCLFGIAYLTLLDSELLHWFILPCAICGCLMGKDFIAWCRGKVDTFDPKALIGALGALFFCFAPLLFVHWNVGTTDMPAPPDWRDWFGLMAIINVFGVLLYLGAQRMAFRRPSKANRRTWMLPNHVSALLLVALVVSLGSWGYYFVSEGGFAAIARSREDVYGGPQGKGLMMVAGESAPFLLFVLLTMFRGPRMWQRRSYLFATILAITLIVLFQIVVSGLSGSRTRTLWATFALLAGVHYFWRPLKRRHALFALVPALLFVHFYTYYKDFKTDIFKVFQGVPLEFYTTKSRRGVESMIVGDIGRSEMQASILYVLLDSPPEYYDLRYGKTYAFGSIQLTPSWIMPVRRRPFYWSKSAAAYEHAYGKGVYVPGIRGLPMTRQFGLTGEAMLNFGLVGPFLVFPLWGYAVGRLRRMLSTLQPGDTRLFLAPVLTNMAFVALPSDWDNVVVVFVWRALYPLLVLWIASVKRPVFYDLPVPEGEALAAY